MVSKHPLAVFSLLRLVLAAALLAPPAGAAPGADAGEADPLAEKRATVQALFEKGDPIPLKVRQAVARAAQLPPEPGMTPEQADQLKQDSADLVKAVEQAVRLQKSGAMPQDSKQGDELAVQVTGRVQETCALLKIVDAKRQEEAVKLYVSRWQSGRTDLTPEKAAKEHELAQSALHRGQDQQKGATARASARLGDASAWAGGGVAGGVPAGVVAAPGGRAPLAAPRDLSAAQRQAFKPVGPAPPTWKESLLQTAQDHSDRGTALLIQAENETGVKKLGLQAAAGVHAVREGLTKLLAGDPETVERAAMGAAIGASVVALPAAALGASGTGVTMLGLGRATLAVGMPALNATGVTGSVSAVMANPTVGTAAMAAWDVTGGKVAGPVLKVASKAYGEAKVLVAAKRIDTAADDAKAMRMSLGAAETPGVAAGSRDQLRVFSEARLQAKGMHEAPVLTERIGVDISARNAAVAASEKQVGDVCASHSVTVCGISNGADLTLKDVKSSAGQVKNMETMDEINFVKEKMAATADPGKIAKYENELMLLQLDLNNTAKNGAQGFNGKQILQLNDKAKLNLDITKLDGRGEALKSQILDKLRNNEAVLASVQLGEQGHAVSVLGHGRNAAGAEVYEIYDSAVHRVLSIPADEFNPMLGMVVKPKTLDFTKSL